MVWQTGWGSGLSCCKGGGSDWAWLGWGCGGGDRQVGLRWVANDDGCGDGGVRERGCGATKAGW